MATETQTISAASSVASAHNVHTPQSPGPTVVEIDQRLMLASMSSGLSNCGPDLDHEEVCDGDETEDKV
jgi:hypothetical protein